MPASACPLPEEDRLLGQQRYLAYQPQGGLSNQRQSLITAAIWALALNRTLVLPHLLPHADAASVSISKGVQMVMGQPSKLRRDDLIPYEDLFRVRRIPGLRTMDISALVNSSMLPTFVELPEVTSFMKTGLSYFKAIGWTWERATSVTEIPTSTSAIHKMFGSCKHSVLAFRTLFNHNLHHNLLATNVKNDRMVCPNGSNWPASPQPACRRALVQYMQQTVMPALLLPHPRMLREAHEIAQVVRNLSTSAGGRLGCVQVRQARTTTVCSRLHSHAAMAWLSSVYFPCLCAQVRRGDFLAYCSELKMKIVAAGGNDARSCVQSEQELAANLAAAEAQAGHPIAWFVATDAPEWLRHGTLDRFRLQTLGQVRAELPSTSAPVEWMADVGDMRDIILDQLVCSHAETILLNERSTFRQSVALYKSMREMGSALMLHEFEKIEHSNLDWCYLSSTPSAIRDVCGGMRATDLRVRIVVIAWRRQASLSRLLDSLLLTHTCQHSVPLRFLLDGDAAPAVLSLVRAFKWPHGPATVDAFPPPRLGLRRIWLEAFAERSGEKGHHVVVLEDDLKVSPFWFAWLLHATHKYNLTSSGYDLVERGVVGISLYTPRLNEISLGREHNQPWRASSHIAEPAFLMQLPSSWGALYFAPFLRHFKRFYAVRTRWPLYNTSADDDPMKQRTASNPLLNLPNCRANHWPRSWKRFMIEFMYTGGLTMLYPVMPEEASFSTTFVEPGEHTNASWWFPAEDTSLDGLHTGKPEKTVPLMVVKRDFLSATIRLPRFSELVVIDLHHRSSSACQLARSARAHRHSVIELADTYVKATVAGSRLARHRQQVYEAVQQLFSGCNTSDCAVLPPRTKPIRKCGLPLQQPGGAARRTRGGRSGSP